uniref:Uncharacterized protein LOC111127479 isoform X2 n=1 Tax=Crassostrea virginica TaxID=6565 RepID=A0A8B8DLB0_CRAVI|nr:uncharacterized protein LOC111127479 isoform X2 [Crassostrea virginica]
MLVEHFVSFAALTGIAIVLYGVVFKSSGPDNTAKAGLEEEKLQEMKNIKPANIDKSEMHEYIRKEVQKEIKKHNIDSVVRSDVQKYQQGEAQRVLTPELLEAMIASSVEKVMDKYNKYNDQIQEKMEELKDKISEQKTIKRESEAMLKRFQKLLEEKENNTDFEDLILSVYRKITKISRVLFSNSTLHSKIKFLLTVNVDSDNSVLIVILCVCVILILCVCLALEICTCRLVYFWFFPKKNGKPDGPDGPDSPDSKEKRDLKKLEDSICIVSFSNDYVEKYHVPLAKSLIEYSNWKDFRLKRALIREPESLRFIPPSKIFMVFVDYNERNDLLERNDSTQRQVDPKLKQVPIRRETVRSLMDSLVIKTFTHW